MADIDPKLLTGIKSVMEGKGASKDGRSDTTPEDGGAPAKGADASVAAPSTTAKDESEAFDTSAFYEKWAPRTEGLDRVFRLLSSKREDDFSGALIVEDDFHLKEFIDDLMDMLVGLGKLKSRKALRRVGITPLCQNIGSALVSGSSEEKNALDIGKLLIVDALGAFPPEGMPDTLVNSFISALSRIVDDRYILLVGTTEEVEGLIRSHKVLAPTFGENIVFLKGMDASGVLKEFMSNLEDDLKPQITDEFRAKFKDFVEFNGDILAFKGAELADYLSKEANASGHLILPKDRHTSSSLDDMLDEIVGLENVKETIRGLEQYATFMKRAKGHGSTPPSSNMHMLFQGNPGTGKTMVGRLISRMLYKIGIIKSNKFTEASARDLIAKYVGNTNKMVYDKIQEALGGVLFIDEAYALMPQGEDSVGYGAEAIAELIKGMEDHRDDLIVILAGYEKEMQGLIDANPGLASRIGYTFRFDDYSVEELLQIFRINVTKSGFSIGEGVEDRLRRLFAYFSRFKSFGNGRFVMEVLQKALVNHARNFTGMTANTSDEYLTITVDDVPTRQDMFDAIDWKAQSAEDMLEPLVGLDIVKEEVLALERTVAFREVALKAGIDVPDLNLNMVFQGNPGTGKTTVARIVGSILYNIGAVPSNHFEEIQAKDLMNSSRMSIAKETGKVLDRAMGGVLFLDEAYALMENAGGREALAVLVKGMEDHKGEIVVMFAGYKREMRAFIDENPGLASRIGYTFDFEDYGADDLLEIFRRKMEKAGFELGEGVAEGAHDAFRYFHSVENFGNGRFVDRYIQELIATHAGCYAPEHPELVSKDALPTIKRLCELSATEVLDCTDDEEEAALKRVSIHEAGHAVCRLAATGKTDIVLITVEHEGNGALGYVQHEGKGMMLPTSKNLRDELVCLLGGMSAEEVFFGSFSAGNSSDLEKATYHAARYVATYGMSDAGLVQFVSPKSHTVDMGSLPKETLSAMQKVLDECHDEARRRVEECRPAIDAITAALKEKATLTGEELLAIWETSKPGSEEDRPR